MDEWSLEKNWEVLSLFGILCGFSAPWTLAASLGLVTLQSAQAMGIWNIFKKLASLGIPNWDLGNQIRTRRDCQVSDFGCWGGHIDCYVVQLQHGGAVVTYCSGACGMTDVNDILGSWRCERLDSEELPACGSIWARGDFLTEFIQSEEALSGVCKAMSSASAWPLPFSHIPISE